jgi:hypothetical protein
VLGGGFLLPYLMELVEDGARRRLGNRGDEAWKRICQLQVELLIVFTIVCPGLQTHPELQNRISCLIPASFCPRTFCP